MNKIEEAITEWFGERCAEPESGCPCCDAWAEYDALIAIRKLMEEALADGRGKGRPMSYKTVTQVRGVTYPSMDAASAAAYEAAGETAAEFIHRRLYEANMPACSYHSRDIKAAIRALATPDQTAALDRVRAEAKAEALNGPWSDEPDEMTPAILASHPINTKDYKTYAEALELVSNRHSKGALVCLVNHLLASIP